MYCSIKAAVLFPFKMFVRFVYASFVGLQRVVLACNSRPAQLGGSSSRKRLLRSRIPLTNWEIDKRKWNVCRRNLHSWPFTGHFLTLRFKVSVGLTWNENGEKMRLNFCKEREECRVGLYQSKAYCREKGFIFSTMVYSGSVYPRSGGLPGSVQQQQQLSNFHKRKPFLPLLFCSLFSVRKFSDEGHLVQQQQKRAKRKSRNQIGKWGKNPFRLKENVCRTSSS